MLIESVQDSASPEARPPASPVVAQDAGKPKYQPAHIYIFGGIAVGAMIGLLVAVAAWSFVRSRRRQKEADDLEKRRLGVRRVGQDAWSESADRMKTPTVRELNKQHGPKRGAP